MTEIEKEKILKKYPLPVSINKTEIILKQMKESICIIENKNGDGTGFFCKILNKKLLITNNHVINKEIIKNKKIIKVKINDNKIKKDIRIKDYYTSIEYDTTIIEIEEEENINYLEIDDEIFDDNIDLYNKSIYIMQYPKYGDEQKGAVSYGVLNGIKDEYNLIYNCSTDHGSSGSPILKLSNQKIIGIHKEGVSKYNYNRGTLLKYPINEYLNKINEKIKKKNNEIKLLLKIEKEDINKDIYFLDNTDGNYRDIGEPHHDNLKEVNELNTEIFINNKKYKYSKSFKPEREGLYEINIKFNIKIIDCSLMFGGCSNLTNIDLSCFDTKNVIDMSYMFNDCSKLAKIDLSSFDTKNVTNMSYMFCGCSKLANIDLSSFNTKNVTNMSDMFGGCSNLSNIDLSSFDTKNVTNMRGMFCGCSNLAKIDLSSFDTKNVTNMSFMFDGCSNLTNIDLSSFDTKNIINMNDMFSSCSNLNKVKINNISSNLLKELLEDTNANIIDQFGNNIPKNKYLNNKNQNNFFNNNYIKNKINNNTFNYNMVNNNINNNMMNNSMMNSNMMNNNMIYNNMMNNNIKNNLMNNKTYNNMNNNMMNNMMNNNMEYNMINNNIMNFNMNNNNMMYNNQNNKMMNNKIH